MPQIIDRFRGEFATSTSLLIPQVENSLRYILKAKDIITWKHDKEGIQDEKGLNELFEPRSAKGHREDLEDCLGADTVLDLRMLLVERVGANLRNQHAHGLIGHGGYFSPPVVYFWGLVLHFVTKGALIRDEHLAAHGVSTEAPPDATQDKTEAGEDKPGVNLNA